MSHNAVDFPPQICYTCICIIGRLYALRAGSLSHYSDKRRIFMINLKKTLAITMSLIMCSAAAGCGSGDSSNADSDPVLTTREPTVSVEEDSTVDGIPEGEDAQLEWLSYFDLNPTDGGEKSTELTLFEQKGGSIKYTRTTSTNKYEKLAARIISDDPPDMFWYEKKMTFPANCIQNMFQPVDDVVNFDDELWADVKETADQFTVNGYHYVAPISFNITSLLTYDADRIADIGADDPYELYLEDEWDWDAMEEIMSLWVSSAGADETRSGLNGWFHSFIFQTTGETIIKINPETGMYENNLYSANLERAATWLYDISKDGLVDTTWYGDAGEAFKAGILFYSMGPWASTGTAHTPTETENWRNVLIPRDPNSDTYYMALDTTAYMWVKGSEKDAAFKCWLECCRIAETDENYLKTKKDKFDVDNPYWTDEMYDLAYRPMSNDKITIINDPGYGISTLLSDDDAATNDSMEAIIPYLYSSVSKSDEEGVQFTWASLRDTYNNTINSELGVFNDKLANFDINAKYTEPEESSSEAE